MITARKNRVADWLLATILRRVMRRRFRAVLVSGLERVEGLDAARSVIACVNHTNWWDGFVVQLLSREMRPRVSFLAQEERHLARYPLFRWCGVFGIDLDSSPRAGLRYALRMLGSPNVVLWFFPQGRIASAAAPIEIKEGAHFLAMKSGAQLLPVILRYEWLSESRPTILVSIGEPLACDAPSERLQGAMVQLFKGMDAPVSSRDLSKFRPLIRRALSLNKRWDWLVHRLTGRMEPFEELNR